MGIYDDDDTNEPTPGDLRKALEKANKKNSDLEALVKQLEARARKADINEVLQDLKLPAKVSKLIPSDVEPTKEAVKAWAEEFADVIGFSAEAPAGTPTETETAPQNAAPSVSPEYIAAMTQAAQTASVANPVAPDPSGLAGKLGELAGKNLTFEELAKELRSLQNTKG